MALIQGASRGLGLEYVRQLLQRDGQRCTLRPVAAVVLCMLVQITAVTCTSVCGMAAAVLMCSRNRLR